MSLEDLKRENAEDEPTALEEPQSEPEEELNAAEEPEGESVEAEGSEEAEEPESEDVEAWMQSDEQASQSDGTVPESDLIKMRTKLKSKIRGKDEELSGKNQEIEALRAEIENLKSSSVVAAAPSGKPKREDFFDHDDPDEAYVDALTDWKLSQKEKSKEKDLQQEQIQERNAKIKEGVDSHYERAAKLLESHSLSADVYKKADDGFRSVIKDSLNLKSDIADHIADDLISQVGEGSEKLIMYIGNSAQRRDMLKASLVKDPTFLSAMRLIGKWETEMSAPTKRSSKAPKPTVRVGSGETVDLSSGLHRKYKDAHKSGNAQKAFDAKRQAKAQNIDVSNW